MILPSQVKEERNRTLHGEFVDKAAGTNHGNTDDNLQMEKVTLAGVDPEN